MIPRKRRLPRIIALTVSSLVVLGGAGVWVRSGRNIDFLTREQWSADGRTRDEIILWSAKGRLYCATGTWAPNWDGTFEIPVHGWMWESESGVAVAKVMADQDRVVQGYHCTSFLGVMVGKRDLPRHRRLVSIPLAHLLGIGVTPILLATFSLWRNRARVGFCRRCRYDLTGNVSGVCPECGTKVG